MMKIVSISLLLIVLISACESTNNGAETPREPVVQSKSLKRGVSFSYQFEEDIQLLGPGTAWSYNWGPSQSATYDAAMAQHGIDYCPMAWNGINEAALDEYMARNPQTMYLLGFNEPNLTDQANMTPQQAAERWPAVKEAAAKHQLKIISPAMNYGTLEGYHDPIVWLDEFFALVPLSEFDGIAIHCYMPSASALKSYVERFKKYGKPIWMTEFCAWEGHVTPETQRKFLSEAFNYMESDPDVQRYAWFIPRAGGGHDKFPYMALLKSTYPVELTELGKIYNQLSSFDKELFYVEQQQIEAEHYSNISVSESVGKTGWTNGPLVRVTTDAPSQTLELYNFLKDQWVEYQIDPLANKTYTVEIRYATFVDTELDISINGEAKTSISLPSTTQEYIWNTAQITLPLEKGKQTMRLTVADGKANINWLRYQ